MDEKFFSTIRYSLQQEIDKMARQNFLGHVISQGKMDKTIKVRVFHKKFEHKVQKEFKVKKDYLVHDEANICREGDLVRIEATRPLSSRKFFSVAEIKKNQGQQFATYQKEAKLQVSQEENQRNVEFLSKRDILDANAQQSLYKDLSNLTGIQFKKEFNEDDVKIINELKSKYGITSWTNSPDENKELFTSSITHLANKIDAMSLDIKLSSAISEILENEEGEVYSTIAQKVGITTETKKNIKKNLIRKYIKETSAEDLAKLGIQL